MNIDDGNGERGDVNGSVKEENLSLPQFCSIMPSVNDIGAPPQDSSSARPTQRAAAAPSPAAAAAADGLLPGSSQLLPHAPPSSSSSSPSPPRHHRLVGAVAPSPSGVLNGSFSIVDPTTVGSMPAQVADPLTLDVRSYRKLEDAIVTVKLFIERVRVLTLAKYDSAVEQKLQGDIATAAARPSSMFVTIVTGEGGAGSSGRTLRTILHAIFRNCQIVFVDDNDGPSFQVDALSGIWDAGEDHQQQAEGRGVSAAASGAATAATTRRVEEGQSLENRSFNRPPTTLGSSNGRDEYLQDSTLNEFNTFSSNVQKSMLMQALVTQQRLPLAQHQHQLPLQQETTPLSHRSSTTPLRSPDHGAGVLCNPLNSLAHTFLTREHTKDFSLGGKNYNNAYQTTEREGPRGFNDSRSWGEQCHTSSHLWAKDSQKLTAGTVRGGQGGLAEASPSTLDAPHSMDPLNNGLNSGMLARNGSGIAAANQQLLGTTSASIPELCLAFHQAGYHHYHHQNQQIPSLPQCLHMSPTEVALHAALSGPGHHLSRVPSKSLGGSSSSGMHTTLPSHSHRLRPPSYQPDGMMTWTAATSFSQHMLPTDHPSKTDEGYVNTTHRQRAHDTESQLMLKRAASESAKLRPSSNALLPSGGATESSQPVTTGDGDHLNEEHLIKMASRISILEEKARREEAQRREERELELAIRQSEAEEAQKRAEEDLLRESEEELLQKLLIQSREEEDKARQQEEELLQQALGQSEAEEAQKRAERDRLEESEEELLRKVLIQSREEEEKARQEEEELLQQVLTKSMAAEEDADEEELAEELIRRSIRDGRGNCGSAEDGGQEEMIERVPKLSLEEEEKIDEDEAELIRKGMEQSTKDVCYDECENACALSDMEATKW